MHRPGCLLSGQRLPALLSWQFAQDFNQGENLSSATALQAKLQMTTVTSPVPLVDLSRTHP